MDEPFGYCLNTATIRGHRLGIVEQVELAAAAGYGGIEPWIDDIEAYRDAGGSLRDLRRRIADAGLTVAGAVGFAEWIVDNPKRRAAGLEQARRDMDIVRRIGGTHIASPPAGATKRRGLSPLVAAERYRALLEVGERAGVVPVLELWGFSRPLSRLGEVAMVAMETGRRDARVLLDVYHIYKGGSDYAGLTLLRGEALPVLHMNDYPARPPRARITDAHRVYPGDGVAPLRQILRDLRAIGFTGWLSLELFNPAYYAQPAPKVAGRGLSKMKAAVRKALGSGKSRRK